MNVGRVAVVTGGASGIGLAVCRRLAADARVAVFDVNGDAAIRVAEEIIDDGGDAVAAAVDVTDRAAVDAALERVRRELGPITIIVTSAAVESVSPFTELKFEDWTRVMDVNVNGTYHSLQPVIPDMIEAGWGRIVTISSSGAQGGAPGMSHYAASKGAVIALTKSLALELAPYGITVNTIPPRSIDTPMFRNSALIKARGESALELAAARIPVGRMGTPEDIAAACAFLCSEDASYITGQVIGVNGGAYM